MIAFMGVILIGIFIFQFIGDVLERYELKQCRKEINERYGRK